MILSSFFTAAAFALSAVSGQPATILPASTTIPIVFTGAVDANHAEAGATVTAKTAQAIRLPNGNVIPAGSAVRGHVVTSTRFTYDKTPYAKQGISELSIHFDSVSDRGQQVPLNVYLRAMAGPLDAWSAVEPKSTDLDPQGTTTQVGGDLVTPSQNEVRSQGDEVVGYLKRGGVYAHLIAGSGNSPEGCDASDTEQSMSIFSASACGLYGFTDTTLEHAGRNGDISTIVLRSRRHAPKIYTHTAALLEVIAQ